MYIKVFSFSVKQQFAIISPPENISWLWLCWETNDEWELSLTRTIFGCDVLARSKGDSHVEGIQQKM